MDELLPYIYAAAPFVVTLLLALLAVVAIGIGIVAPRLLVYPYLAVFFMFNSTSYGNLAVISYGSGVYSRGSGLLYFALLLWAMLGIWVCARISTNFNGQRAAPCNLWPWFLGWFVLLAAHVAVALFLGKKLSAPRAGC